MALAEIGARLRLQGAAQYKRDVDKAADATGRLGKAADNADSKLARLGRAAGRASGALRGLGKGVVIGGITAAAVGVAGLSAALIQGFRDAAALQTMMNKTAAVVASTGGAANVSARGVLALADELESLSGIDGDAIINAQNLLLTFTQVKNGAGELNHVFDQATRTAVDMAAALGSDPASAAMQLGKALNDPIKGVGALSKVGVSFTAGQKKVIKSLVASGKVMDAQKVILKELQVEFGGAAKAAGSGFEGSLARVKDAFGDAMRDTATPLLPGVTAAMESLSVVTGKAGAKMTEWAKSLALAFKLGGTGGLIKMLDHMTGANGKLVSTFNDFKTVMVEVAWPTLNRMLRTFGRLLKLAADHTTTAYVALGLFLARAKLIAVATVAMKAYAWWTGRAAAAQVGLAATTTTTAAATRGLAAAALATQLRFPLMIAAMSGLGTAAAVGGPIALAVAGFAALAYYALKAERSASSIANIKAGTPTATTGPKQAPRNNPLQGAKPLNGVNLDLDKPLYVTPQIAPRKPASVTSNLTASGTTAQPMQNNIKVFVGGKEVTSKVIEDMQDRAARR